MHHATKKALISKYSDLLAAGATLNELRTALDNEEKVESKEDAEDIIASLEAPDAPEKGTFTVAPGKSFRDVNDYGKVWEAGDDVAHFSESRLEGLIEAGLVKKGK